MPPRTCAATSTTASARLAPTTSSSNAEPERVNGLKAQQVYDFINEGKKMADHDLKKKVAAYQNLGHSPSLYSRTVSTPSPSTALTRCTLPLGK